MPPTRSAPRPLAVLRPEPGNAATAQRIAAAGYRPIRLPLFATQPIVWEAPEARDFDALLLTSANAARLAGEGLRQLAGLPLFAVGAATAEAARAAGLSPVHVGDDDGAALVASAAARGVHRALLLAGHERRLDTGGIIALAIPVYASEPLPIDPRQLRELAGTVALLHSPRAAARLAELVEADRAAIRIAAISPATAEAAGSGWAGTAIALAPNDDALVAAAIALAD